MKKQVKILSIILMVVMMLASFTNVVCAANTTISDIPGIIEGVGEGNGTDTDKIQNFGKTIVTILQVVGVVVAIVILLVLGLKYMMGSAEEKAEYKKTMIPYLVGAVLIFAASTIVSTLYNVINSGAGSI